MANISKVTFYYVPFRYLDQDRIVEDVDVKLAPYKVKTLDVTNDKQLVAWDINNELVGRLTINHTTLGMGGVNYCQITSTYFSVPTYHFLDRTERYESSKATTYSLKMDVMATFGKTLLTKLAGQKVKVARSHQDRYVVNGENVTMNTEHYGLVNSDFKVGDTKGQKLIYDGNGNYFYSLTAPTIPSECDSYSGKFVKITSGGYTLTGEFVSDIKLLNEEDYVEKDKWDELVTGVTLTDWMDYNGNRISTKKFSITNDYKTVNHTNSYDDARASGKGLELKPPFGLKIKNSVIVGKKVYWAYAIIQGKGEPNLKFSNDDFYIAPVDIVQFENTKTLTSPFVGYYIVLFDENKKQYQVVQELVSPITVGEINKLSNLTKKLQENKIINIFLSPFQHNLSRKTPSEFTNAQIPLEDIGDVCIYQSAKEFFNPVSALRLEPYLEDYDYPNQTLIFQTDDSKYLVNSKAAYEVYNANTTLETNYLFVLNYTNYLKWWNETQESVFDNDFKIATNKLSSDVIMDTFQRKTTTTNLKDEITKNDYENVMKYELPLLNTNICPITFMHETQEHVIDIVNFYKDDNINEFKGKYAISPSGVSINLGLSQNQYVTWNENIYISYGTSQGADYLTTHKAQIAAQKQGVELQAQLSRTQTGEKLAGAIGFTLANATNPIYLATGVAQIALASREIALYGQIKNNEIDKINGKIQDAYATAPSVKQTTGDDYVWGIDYELKHKWNWMMKVPNKNILQPIYYFYQKYGYKIDDFWDFNDDVWKSRVKWNYLEISNVREYLKVPFDTQPNDIDETIIAEFNNLLEGGVRIWHEENFDINYTQPNWEKKIVDAL